MMATEKNKLSIYFHSAINCLTERSLLGAFEKQNENYERGDHDVFNSAGSTLATPHFGPENGVHLSMLGWRYGLGLSDSVYEVLPGMAGGFGFYLLMRSR